MPNTKLTDAFLRALPDNSGRDTWHYDTLLPGFFAVKRAKGRITFRIRTDNTHSLRVGRWGPALTAADARELAKAKLREHHIELVTPAARKITLRRFVDEHYAPHFRLRHTSEKNLNNLNPLGMDGKLLTAITPQLVKIWVDKRLADGTNPGTINRNVTALKAVLNYAVAEGWLTASPLARLAKLSEDEFARVRYLSADELKDFLKALDQREAAIRKRRPSTRQLEFADVVRPLVMIAMYTGLRQGELFNLKWDDYVDGMITARTRKTKGAAIRTRRVPVPKPGRVILREWRAQLGAGATWIFPSPRLDGRLTTIAKSWRDLTERAGLSDLRFHDLRHHYGSKKVMGGVDLHTVQILLGHSDPKMTMRYAHLAPQHLRAAAEIF